MTLREMLQKNDVFALGHAMYTALLGGSSRFPDHAQSSYREWDLPELPSHLSKGTKALLNRMVVCDPAKRPTLRCNIDCFER